jgi:hypothetical protein
MFRNFFNLYHRKCDLTGKQVVSMYDVDAPFPVYDMHEWWSDKWSGLDFGMDIDPAKSVFEQIKILHVSVPRMNIMNVSSENTDYCNMSHTSRNCYLIFGCVQNEDCAYGHIVWQSKNCYDCLYSYRCENCYECTDAVQCFGVSFSQNVDNCSDSRFLMNCIGCRNCFGCVGLKNKEYHIFNQPHSKADYENKMAEMNPGHHQVIRAAKTRVQALLGKEVVKYYHGFNCENVTGDYLYNCKNVFDSYDAKNCEDCRFCATSEGFKDTCDCNYSGAKTELSYNSLTTMNTFNTLMCHTVHNGSSALIYCDNCYACKNCFGCAGLKNQEYCIFNKKYSRADYERLAGQLIEGMQTAHAWGEFFPPELSPFAYNETIAYEYFPLGRPETEARGWRYKEKDDHRHYKGPRVQIPEDIAQVSDDLCKEILICEVTNQPYKIIPRELKFLRDHKLPIPRRSPDQRRRDRMDLRNPRHLYARQCAKCSAPIQTTYSPGRPEKVYCEKCYLKEVY